MLSAKKLIRKQLITIRDDRVCLISRAGLVFLEGRKRSRPFKINSTRLVTAVLTNSAIRGIIVVTSVLFAIM